MAESVVLPVYIRGIDQFSAVAAKVTGSAKGMGAAITSFGGALGHAKGQISGLVTSLGVLGGATALFGVGSLLTSSISKARDFGAEVVRLKALTGSTAESMSALASAFDHFGLSSSTAQRAIGFLEKNIGLLVAGDNVATFEKTFGLALTDTNGKIKDANELILTTADYFNNKTIPATEKAAALAKLYGRNWQELIPFLAAGRQGIADVEEEAAKLGLTLSDDNLADLIKLKNATREWDTALGGLQLQIGLALVPALTDLAKAATTFVANNRDGIVNGFKSAAQFAGDLADAINTTVVPAIGAIAGAWNSIPKEFRDLLIGGFVAQKASHWLLGSGPLDWIKKLVGFGASKKGGVLGQLAAQPVFVTNWPAGFGGGMPGLGGAGELAAGAAGLSGAAIYGLLAAGGAVTFAVGALAARAAHQAFPDVFVDPTAPAHNPLRGKGGGPSILYQPTLGPAAPGSLIGRNPDAAGPDMSDDTRETRAISSYNRLIIPGLVPALSGIAKAINAFGYSPAEWASIYARAMAAGGRSEINALRRTHKSLDAIALADAETSKFLTGTAGPFFRDGKNQTRLLKSLADAEAYFRAHGDTKTADQLAADIARLKPPVVNVNTSISVKTIVNGHTVTNRIGEIGNSSYGRSINGSNIAV